jgi:hypothetical protein
MTRQREDGSCEEGSDDLDGAGSSVRVSSEACSNFFKLEACND